MYYHASSVKGITQLTPQSSNHGIPLVYFSTKRENVLVYLSNSIEKYCVETGFSYNGKCQKWGPYGFGKDGRQRLEEYYPNALISTYKGVSGYIYSAETISDSGFSVQIPDVAVAYRSIYPVWSLSLMPMKQFCRRSEKACLLLSDMKK